MNSFPSPAQAVEFKVLNIAEQGDVVFTQRIDRVQMSGRQVELAVTGMLELNNSRTNHLARLLRHPTQTRQAGAGGG